MVLGSSKYYGKYINNTETTKLTTKKQHKIKRNRCSSCGWGLPYKVSINKKIKNKPKKQKLKRIISKSV